MSTSIARSSADTDRLLRLVQPLRIVSFFTLAQHSQCAGLWQLRFWPNSIMSIQAVAVASVLPAHSQLLHHVHEVAAAGPALL